MRVQNERMNKHLSVKQVNTTTKCHKTDEDKYKRHSRDIIRLQNLWKRLEND